MDKRAQIFLMCCDLRSFSKVAKTLAITTSAVSKIISSFEHELGVTLFARTERPIGLTIEALLLQKYLRQTTGSFNDFIAGLKKKNFIKPALRVGLIESLSTTLGVEIVTTLSKEYSQMVVTIGSGDVLIRRLMQRALDLIITNDVALPSKRIFQWEIFEEPSILLLPKALEKNSTQRWTWDRLRHCGYPLIRFGEETGAGRLNNAFLRSHHFNFPERICVENNSFTMALVKADVGWAFTRPTTVLQNIHLKDQICIAQMQEPTLTRKVHIIGRESEFENEAVLLKTFCENYLRKVLIPQLIRIAPWVADKFRVGGKSYRPLK